MKSKRGSTMVHWIAIIAVLISSLAPSISLALTPQKSNLNMMDFVCSASGMQMIATASVDDTKSSAADQSKNQQILIDDHCPYCALQGNYVLPLNNALDFEFPQNSTIYPSLFYKSPKPLFAWLTLPSRAPPSIS